MKNAKTLISLVGTVLAGRMAFQRLREARDEQNDRLELLDAALNLAVVITGTIVILRRLRRGDDA